MFWSMLMPFATAPAPTWPLSASLSCKRAPGTAAWDGGEGLMAAGGLLARCGVRIAFSLVTISTLNFARRASCSRLSHDLPGEWRKTGLDDVVDDGDGGAVT